MKKKTNLLLIALLFSLFISSCEDDPDPILPVPTIENVEIGSGNNHIGVIGRDFHLNANIVAGDKIDLVQVKIEPIAGETYAGDWNFELTWEQFKGAKNTNVHQHFDIPEEAVEGKYDFIIIVTDENGTRVEEKLGITILAAENLPVDPQLKSFMVVDQEANRYVYNFKDEGSTTGDGILNWEETLSGQAIVSGVKGNGRMYVVLINKKHNHHPETIDAIDYSKTIVWNIVEHKDIPTSKDFSNTIFDLTVTPTVIEWPLFTIGSASDNNLPEPNAINELKAWESGKYYVGVIYHNTSYNISLFHYSEVRLVM